MSDLLFNIDEAQQAADDWGFNCGPASLCAVLRKTPVQIRPHLLDFERKGYISPSMMAQILRGLKVPFQRVYECHPAHNGPQDPLLPNLGLVRIQWGGSWTRPKVPIRARYRHTHWIAVRTHRFWEAGYSHFYAFDINAVCVGGWILYDEWKEKMVPWLLKECVPKNDGTWWPTHCWEIKE